MTQNEQELATRIARLLDAGAGELDQPTVDKLAAARKQALARYEARRAPVWSWMTATSGGHNHGAQRWHSSLRTALVAAVVVSAIAIGVTWHSGGSEIADIDAALLTDELPINAFLDQGFDSWLKRASR